MEGKFELKYDEPTLKVYLSGNLDASNAPGLSDEMKIYQDKEVTKIIFCAKELDYIASAGIRVIIFAVQKILKKSGNAYFIGAKEDVISVLKMTGIDDSLIIQDDHEECDV